MLRAMKIDLQKWGPITVLAVATVLLLVVGGLLNVILGHETFSGFLNDLKVVAAAIGGGVGIGRGLHLGLSSGLTSGSDIDTAYSPLALSTSPADTAPAVADEGDGGSTVPAGGGGA